MGLLMLFFCEFVLLIFAIYLIWSWIAQTPFYPSSVRRFEETLRELGVEVTENTRFIDIGSGDGRFVVWGAKKGAESHGIEFNPFLTLWSRFKLFLFRLTHKGKIFNQRFQNHDFSNYDIAYMYIFNEGMDSIKNKLFSEMPKGSVIISNTFKFSGIEADKKVGRYYVYYVK